MRRNIHRKKFFIDKIITLPDQELEEKTGACIVKEVYVILTGRWLMPPVAESARLRGLISMIVYCREASSPRLFGLGRQEV